MRRKSERNKNTSTSSPEKVRSTRRGRRSTVTEDATEEEKPQRVEGEEEQTAESSDDDEPVVKSIRRKLSRGATPATPKTTSVTSEEKEDRPSRSRRKTVQSKVIEPIAEDNQAENGAESIVDTKAVTVDVVQTDVVVAATKERTPSPIKQVTATPSKEESPVDVKESGASPFKERFTSPVKEKSPSPIKEKSPSPIKEKPVSPALGKSILPVEKKSSPVKLRTPSPKKRTPSPKQRTPSPKKRTPSPKQKTSSPKHCIQSPKQKSASPKKRTSQSPKKRAITPKPEEFAPDKEIAVAIEPEPVENVADIATTVEPVTAVKDASPKRSSGSSERVKHSNKQRSPRSHRNNRRRKRSTSSNTSSDVNEPAKSVAKTEPPISIRRTKTRIAAPSPQPSEKATEDGDILTKPQPMDVDPDTLGERKTTTEVQSSADKTPETVVNPNETIKRSYSEKENKAIQKSAERTTTAATEKKPKPIRKRKWLSQKSVEAKPQILAISTDSLKNLISDVKPVPLSDVKLESSPEPEEVEIIATEKETAARKRKASREREQTRRRERSLSFEGPTATQVVAATSSSVGEDNAKEKLPLQSGRKILIVNDGPAKLARPPSPAKFNSTNILYITNLVRPFTVLQLKGLLARTGKISENGFWIDKIKSKCYVKYVTEDEAVETRHALHGVRWPTSNPKCLNVDFGSDAAMGKAIASTSDEMPKDQAGIREERISGGWDRFEADEKRDVPVNRPVREWDLGKKEDLEREPERERGDQRDSRNRPERTVAAERATGAVGGDRGREGDRPDRRRRSTERDRVRRSLEPSPAQKFQKKENDPPLRLLDDLFRKTKTTPCIYWLPLTSEQIGVKEEARREHMAEHRRRTDENIQKEKDRQREREKERERDKDRSRNRDRSEDRRRDQSRTSKNRDGGDRRRF